jgi:pyridoxal phosphate enzyme (YggS family)
VTDVEREVAERLAAIRERIEAAAGRAGRDPSEVTLVGAGKRQSPERLRAAAAAGLRVFGENRVQEAEEHQEILAGSPSLDWHLIGPLQSNKARRAVELFSTVHSVDRGKIARHLDRHAGEVGVTLDCFLEVNLADEDSKSGFRPGGLIERAAPFARLSNLRFVGLMAIPPFPDDPEDSRPWFRKLRELSAAMAGRPEWPDWPGKLSMGMSADFEIAIEEGATHVRVGTDLFGAR